MSESTALTAYKNQYVAKKALFSFLGASFRLFNPDGSLAFFVKQKAFKLKEAIKVCSDEKQTDEMLAIQARSIMDVSATYDVTDSKTGEKVGALKRKGLKSLFKDEWSILDNDDAEVGLIKEASTAMAILSRLFKIIPQKYVVEMNGESAGVIAQKFNPFILGYDVQFEGPGSANLDPRLGVAGVVLLLAIEGRQN